MTVPPRASPRGAAGLWGDTDRPGCGTPLARRGLMLVLAAVFLLRFGLALLLPNIHQADEVYQVAEQATLALHGYGIESWEFQTRSRPASLAMLVEPVYRLPVSAAAHQTLTAALFVALSLLPVWVAFEWVGGMYGSGRAWLAALMMGTWFELVYFAPKATADVVSAELFLLGTFLARPGGSGRRAFVGALAIAVALGLRVQILPAAAIVVLLLLAGHGRTRFAALAGGLTAGLAIVGAAEWAWWGTPFRGHWGYLQMEFTHHVSNAFGREPITFYVKNAVLIYGGALPVIAWLAIRGARQVPILLIALVALVVPFHFIAHKEYRFMIAAVPFMVLLLGIGAAEACDRLSIRPASVTGAAAVVAGWLIAMTAMSLSDSFRPYWTKDRNQVLAFRDIGAGDDACGVGLIGIRWYHTPGYSGLGRDVPIYELSGEEHPERLMPAANYILAATKAPSPPAPYVRWREYSRPLQYLYRRPGGCTPSPDDEVRRPPAPAQ